MPKAIVRLAKVSDPYLAQGCPHAPWPGERSYQLALAVRPLEEVAVDVDDRAVVDEAAAVVEVVEMTRLAIDRDTVIGGEGRSAPSEDEVVEGGDEVVEVVEVSRLKFSGGIRDPVVDNLLAVTRERVVLRPIEYVDAMIIRTSMIRGVRARFHRRTFLPFIRE